jgi:signal transduction histidine kinase
MENQLLIALNRNKLLKNVDISKINLQNVRGKLITIGEGEILYREGDIADIIYLVVSGEINVLKKRLLGKTKSYLFVEDDFFGHEEFFEETTRTSTAVALRDSYLIALMREEVDTLIQQEDEIYVNLREPILEIDEDVLTSREERHKMNQQEHENDFIPFTEDPKWGPKLEDNKIDKDEAKENPSFTHDESLEPFPDNLKESETKLSKTFKENKHEEEPEVPFDESAFLNEDGIPKAEGEIPEIQFEAKVENKNTEEDLNDALFQILSGTQEAEYTPPKKTETYSVPENDDAFLSSIGFEKPQIPEKKTPEHIKETPEVKPEPIIPLHEEEKEIPPYAPIIKPFEIDKEIEVSEEELKQVEQNIISPIIIPPIEKNIEERRPNTITKETMDADELQMIIKAAELVNSNIRVDEVLKNIVTVASNLTSADRGTLYLIDKERKELWSLITMGEEMREIRLRIGEGLAGFVAKSGETINLKDVRKDPRFKSDFDRESGYNTKNMICFPIRNNKKEIIGVLQLLNSANGEFSKRDEEFLSALSIHSAIALQNAEMVEKLLEGERVQSLGKMANFLIQDIKKPILVSKRYAEHLRSKQLLPDMAQVINMLLEQLTQVADLVQTTSSYSEGKTILRVLNVSLNNALADYSSRVEQYVESRNCKIVTQYDKDVTVKLDVKEFFQCYTHIVKNACDAMPDGGSIFVTTKRVDKNVEIQIRDTGLGIPDSFRDKIFEPFMSFGKKEGTGLGLSITKKIVEAHNGSVDVKSTLGEGATFIILLPMASVF